MWPRQRQPQAANPDPYDSRLSEEDVIDGFHVFLTSALAQAKAERLLDTETLASAEADIVICGPALCLYFAALRSTTNPPSVPMPRAPTPATGNASAKSAAPTTVLSQSTCPPLFLPFMRVWAATVPKIQALSPEFQHDLARILCDQAHLRTDLPREVQGIAADLRAVAIEISQRRTFQDRYAGDLQAAIDAGDSASASASGGSPRVKAAFVPPPSYEASSDAGGNSPRHSAPPSPLRNPAPLPAGAQAPGSLSPATAQRAGLPPAVASAVAAAAAAPPRQSTLAQANASAIPSGPPPRQPGTAQASGSAGPAPVPVNVQPPTRQSTGEASARPPRANVPASLPSLPARTEPTTTAQPDSPASPNLLPINDPPIQFIRETLYAALAEVLATTPGLRALLARDRVRAYFAAVGLAVLHVARTCIVNGDSIRGVLGRVLGPHQCPPPLRPLLTELAAIGADAARADDEDSAKMARDLGEGRSPGVPRMERVRETLEYGVGYEDAQSVNGREESRRSLEGRAVQFANRVNALALRLVKLPQFRERQDAVFEVLAGAQ